MLSISCYSWVKSWRNKNLKIYPACVSKYNSDCKKQVIILMISNKLMELSSSKKTISTIKWNNIKQ